MKSVLRMRHYCDFCKKSTGSKPSMLKHEGSCTANPARVCRMCSFGQLIQQPMDALVREYVEKGWKALHALAEGCPACIFAAVRQTPHGGENEPEKSWEEINARLELENSGGWEFKAACKQFLADHRPEEWQGSY